MKHPLHILTTLAILKLAHSAPTDHRRSKHLSFLDYSQPEVEFAQPEITYNAPYDLDQEDYVAMALEERALPRKPPVQPYNSPIYYIRLPAQPYVFVPGLGYVSQPPQAPQVSPFVNLPLSFVANGKPSNIYQWSAAYQGFPTQAPPPTTYQPAPSLGVVKPQKPKKPAQPDSTIHRLPGTFSFNGKPEDIFVLRDSYNSLLNDVLQNVYP